MTGTRMLTLGLTIGFTIVASAQQQNTSSYTQLGTALRLEEVNGNCREALPIFQRLAADGGTPRDVAARALLHVGTCRSQLRLGDGRAEYQAVISRYGDQAQVAAAARARIDTFNRKPKDAPSQHLVATGDDADPFGFVTADGRWLARPDWSIGDMVLRDMNKGDVHRLLRKPGSDPGSVYRAMLSPDGKAVAYVWLTNCCRDSHFELRLLSLDRDQTPRVMASSPELTFPELIAWSADSRSLLVNVSGRGRSELRWITTSTGDAKSVKALDRRMRPDVPNRPSVSPDGRYIAYAALPATPKTPLSNKEFDRATTYIYVIGADGAREFEAVKGNSINESPVWTPDGRHLLFVSNRSGTFGLWSIAVQDGKPVGEPAVLLKDTGRISPMGMTRSGRYYFSRGDTGGPTRDVFIGTVEHNGNLASSPTLLSSTSLDQNRDPAWSPDGKWIVFVRGLQRITSNPPLETVTDSAGVSISVSMSDLVFHSVQSGEEIVHPSGASNPTPVWMHDNKTVLIRGNGGDIRAFDVAHGESAPLGVRPALQPLLSAQSAQSSTDVPAWQRETISSYAVAPDDKVLYFSVSNRLFTFELATKAVKELWTGPTGKTIQNIALSPDGSALVAAIGSRLAYRHELTRVPTNGGASRVLAEADRLLDWSRDGRFVYFVGDHRDRTQLLRVAADGTKAPEPAGSVLPGQGALSFSPDGSRVVFTASTRAPELWVLDNIAALLEKP